MVTVPVLMQRLVDLHGVDAEALTTELKGAVRTRTWPGSSPEVHAIRCLRDDFPRFKGVVVKGALRITAMRLTEDVVFSNGSRSARLVMPRPALPQTVINALAGRRLADVVDHAAIDADTLVTQWSEVDGADGVATLTLQLDLRETSLRQRAAKRGPPVATKPADLDALVARTHDASTIETRMPVEAMLDPRSWTGAPRGWSRIVGLRNETSGDDGAPVIAVRFPYDRKTAVAIGRGSMGAWFDRETYSWRVVPTNAALAGLSVFLANNADVVVTHDGSLNFLRTG